jgi:hypothetical protein
VAIETARGVKPKGGNGGSCVLLTISFSKPRFGSRYTG